FFQHGYKEGYSHGRTHGLIEGRALGKEKGLEIWEEVGYYKGFSSFWRAVYQRPPKDPNSRALHHIKFILSAIDRFPTVNPSNQHAESSVDIAKLLTLIRSRHKALCAILGVKPRLTVVEADDRRGSADEDSLEGSMNHNRAKRNIWRLDNPEKSGSLSY
ncbi:uncharacterized protein EI90DRAFT_2926930, partial [Cantharellus anzutake]|uniref:uncharacterized protein n=1 Tax=Cantharellus anzutake TaxID=1750568 RepID=UPI001904025F